MQREVIYTTVSQGQYSRESSYKERYTPSIKPKRSHSVPWSTRKKASHYYLERPRPSTIMGLQERIESRPPVTKDITGPTPCSYTLRTPYTGPATKIGPPSKYPRGALPSTSANREVWTLQVNNNETPCPSKYLLPGALGDSCPTNRCYPAYSMGTRLKDIHRPAVDVPAPNKYKVGNSQWKGSPAFSIGYRRHKKSWTFPGPAQYSPRYSVCRKNAPSYSMQGRSSIITGLK